MAAIPLPPDHDARMARARLSLDGLSVGDAFGATVYDPGAPESLRTRPLPPGPWEYTDDTVMALGVVEVLARQGRIDQDDLAAAFARRYWTSPRRGYGPNVVRIFRAMAGGVPWREAAGLATPGRGWLARLAGRLGLGKDPGPPGGSLGNGGAMRVAPVGAYFGDDVARVVAEARASAEVTHAHPDGVAGAVAVALAAAWAWRCGARQQLHRPGALLSHAVERTPDGPTRERLALALTLPADASADLAARRLGNGCPITSAETVPFCLWCASRHLGNFEEALWAAASVGGDVDTICAIVGGVVALAAGPGSIPVAWLSAREPLAL